MRLYLGRWVCAYSFYVVAQLIECTVGLTEGIGGMLEYQVSAVASYILPFFI